jgi:transposase
MVRKKKVYSKEFKEEAVRLSYQRANIKELADELDIDVQRIYKWRARNNKSTTNSKKISSNSVKESVEIKQLKKALKNSELELEILKKAVHIFSKSDGKSINL